MKRHIGLLSFTALLGTALAPGAHAASFLVTGIFGGGTQAFDASTGASEGTFAPPPVQGSFQVSGVDVGPNGNVLIANYGSDPGIFAYSSAGAPLGRLATAPGIILNMKIGPDGNLYVLDQHDTDDAVDVYNPVTGAYLRTALDNGQYYLPGFDVAPNGNLLMDAQLDLQIWSNSGNQELGSIPESTYISHLLAAPNGDVYLASLGYSTYPNGIWKCTGCESGSGTLTQFATYTDGMGGLEIGQDGDLYVLAGQDVLKFDINTGADLGVFASSALIGDGYEIALSNTTFSATAPEPATVWLVGVGACLAFAGQRRRARR